MSKVSVLDAMFYNLFLDDISREDFLFKILDNIDFQQTPKIIEEIKKRNPIPDKFISNNYSDEVKTYSKILENHFGSKERGRGEHEVIALAEYLHTENKLDTIVTDDRGAVKTIIKNFNHLNKYHVRCLRFIFETYNTKKILNKAEFQTILDLIEISKYRVNNEVISTYRYLL